MTDRPTEGRYGHHLSKVVAYVRSLPDSEQRHAAKHRKRPKMHLTIESAGGRDPVVPDPSDLPRPTEGPCTCLTNPRGPCPVHGFRPTEGETR